MTEAPQEHAWQASVHRVGCTERRQVRDASGEFHSHVAALGVEDADGTIARMEIVEVIDRFRRGDRFVIAGGFSTNASIEPAVCPACRTATLAEAGSSPGADPLDSLPPCASERTPPAA
jgi:hypothetical protein